MPLTLQIRVQPYSYIYSCLCICDLSCHIYSDTVWLYGLVFILIPAAASHSVFSLSASWHTHTAAVSTFSLFSGYAQKYIMLNAVMLNTDIISCHQSGIKFFFLFCFVLFFLRHVEYWYFSRHSIKILNSSIMTTLLCMAMSVHHLGLGIDSLVSCKHSCSHSWEWILFHVSIQHFLK